MRDRPFFKNPSTGIVACALAFACVAAHGASLQLDITGKISNYTDAKTKAYHLSESDILAMPAHEITTSTPWASKSVWRGISLSDLLKRVGATGTKLRIEAYDDYVQFGLPVSDASRYGVILAYSQNGKRLDLSTFGPLCIIYPRDQFPSELVNSITEGKFEYQIKHIDVQ